jgi:hypothetical protein
VAEVAAEQGNPVAQNRMARICAIGRGVEADPVEAAKWHLLASEAGRTDAELDTFVEALSPTSSAPSPIPRRALHGRGIGQAGREGRQPDAIAFRGCNRGRDLLGRPRLRTRRGASGPTVMSKIVVAE